MELSGEEAEADGFVGKLARRTRFWRPVVVCGDQGTRCFREHEARRPRM